MIGTEAIGQAGDFHERCRFAGEDVVDGDAEATGLGRPCGGFEGGFLQVVGGEKGAHIGRYAGRVEISGENERAGDAKEDFADFIQFIAMIIVEIGLGDVACGERQFRAVEVDMGDGKPVAAQIAETVETAFQQWSFDRMTRSHPDVPV